MYASPDPQAPSNRGQPRGFITDVVLSAVEPGVNNSVLVLINAVFVLLLVTLTLILVLLTGFNVHVIIMCLLSVGVLIGVNWYNKCASSNQLIKLFYEELAYAEKDLYILEVSCS